MGNLKNRQTPLKLTIIIGFYLDLVPVHIMSFLQRLTQGQKYNTPTKPTKITKEANGEKQVRKLDMNATTKREMLLKKVNMVKYGIIEVLPKMLTAQ